MHHDRKIINFKLLTVTPPLYTPTWCDVAWSGGADEGSSGECSSSSSSSSLSCDSRGGGCGSDHSFILQHTHTHLLTLNFKAGRYIIHQLNNKLINLMKYSHELTPSKSYTTFIYLQEYNLILKYMLHHFLSCYNE